MFEATHGTAPKYTGQNKANPGAVLLSGVLLLEFLGWFEAAKLVTECVEKTFAEADETAKKGPGGKLHVTYDIARQFPGYGEQAGASSTAFAERVIHHMK
jgi:isocitrate dehydrogenase